MQHRPHSIPQQAHGDAFLKRPPSRILRDNKSFRELYDDLTSKDVVVTLLNIKPAEEYLFTDLASRGIKVFPPVLAQQLSRSKCLQAALLHKWMVPHTFVARDRHDLIKNIQEYGKHNIKRVVTKQNRFNCGLGIHVWDSIEDVYNQACFGGLQYPFVVQPLIDNIRDVRVIWFSNYKEAYWRRNRNTFRNNLYFGGESGPFELDDTHEKLCREAMKRGQFPYAHIDLMIAQDGCTYMAEINLRGGLKGARLTAQNYKELVAAEEERFLASLKI